MSNLLPEKIYALFDTPVNQKLILSLSSKGSNTILFPPIGTKKIDLSGEEYEDLKNLKVFDWIIFPDILTVELFLQNLEELGIDLFELDALNVCVFGEAIADKLRFVQLHADVIADSGDDDEVFQTLSNYLVEKFQNLKFLLTKEISLEYKIKNTLTYCGAVVNELNLYKSEISCKSKLIKAKTLLNGGAIDEFIFSSEEDLIALRHYFAGESIAEVMSDIKVSVISPNIFQTLKENNLRPLYFQTNDK